MLVLIPILYQSQANDASIVIPALCSNMKVNFVVTAVSIKLQSMPPKEIIVVVSGCKPSFRRQVASKYRDILYPIPVRFLFHRRILERGAARNSGVKRASGSHILFFDDDDIMVRDYVRIVMGLFDRSDAKLVLHGYNPSVIPCDAQVATIVAKSDDLKALARVGKQMALSEDFAHGHMAVQARVLNHIEFEDPPGCRCEDTDLVRRMLRTECDGSLDCIATSAQLSVYIPSKRQSRMGMLWKDDKLSHMFKLFTEQANIVCTTTTQVITT